MKTNTIIQGDCLTELKKLPDESIDCVITSPPYLGLRNYQLEPQIWDGDKNCEHNWNTSERYLHRGSTKHAIHAAQDKPGGFHTNWKTQDNFCNKCGAWKGSLGLEPNFEMYSRHLLEITAELKRVLKPNGCFFLNIGDCYASSGSEESRFYHGNNQGKHKLSNDTYSGRARDNTFQSKCLMMMPERLAIKMIDEQGWILRNKAKWAKQILDFKERKTKGSVMPTSVKDRFNESGEELYFFVKSNKPTLWYNTKTKIWLPIKTKINQYGIEGEDWFWTTNPKGERVKKSYWERRDYYSNLDAVRLKVQTEEEIKRYNEIPEDYGKKKLRGLEDKGKGLNRWMSGTPNYTYQGKFAENPDAELFNSPRARTQRNKDYSSIISAATRGLYQPHKQINDMGKNLPTVWLIGSEPHNFQKELGVDIDHFAVFPEALYEIPIKFGTPKNGIVLDPFCGSGTALIVAKKLGRNYLGIDLNKEYIKIAETRLRAIPQPLF